MGARSQAGGSTFIPLFIVLARVLCECVCACVRMCKVFFSLIRMEFIESTRRRLIAVFIRVAAQVGRTDLAASSRRVSL